ncbi:hypothetical protein FF124_04970 [Martelella lutilitoris]|uniref:Uncharacterized protein n=1 Tax=Martelella lutilitoris TaxID=2583532 RepID=A0A5C4JXI3_9HYPH|nr:hypothetical protein [Martelella lutilitoris]TNB49339.1 hypothetical protein FF124_04970 [Martelella lutilitoris]
MTLGVKEALDAFQAQNNAADKLWAYFSAVSLAVAGYVISYSSGDGFSTARILAIAGAYAIFCVNNNMALGAAQSLLVSLAQAARDSGGAGGVPLDIRVLSCRAVRWGQALMACAVIIGTLIFGRVFG